MAGYPKSNLSIATLMGVALLLAITAVPDSDTDATEQIPVSLSISQPLEAPTPIAVDLTSADSTQTETQSLEPAATITLPRTTFEVRRGDSLATIFQKAGLSPRELHNVISLGPETAILGKIIPGQKIHIQKDADGNLQQLEYAVNRLKSLWVERESDQLRARWSELEPEILLNYKTATITAENPSVYEAGKDAGLSANLIMNLSYVFQWDISFALDLRQGDTFTVLYEDVYVEGEKIRQGEILAAKFTNLGKTYTAVRYEENGRTSYFTPEGRSLRKAFLRDPVHFSHVSSSFNLRRLHPIHKRVMPHRGIDYAANRGTPVVASGDGKVTIARQNNASGRYVVIQHGEQYTTKYLHLNAFARGIKAGTRVRQGQTIGYVGDSGWATAPHLHYEFLVDGVHRNPRTVKLPKADPILARHLPQFQSMTAPLLAQLESVAGNKGLVKLDTGD